MDDLYFNNKNRDKKHKKFLEAQIEEIKKYKWIESEKKGKDTGEEACREWVEKFALKFRDNWEDVYGEFDK